MAERFDIARMAAFAHWPQAWRDIATPFERLELGREDMQWLLARNPVGGPCSPAEALAQELRSGIPYLIWITSLLGCRRIPPEDDDSLVRAERALAARWPTEQAMLGDALARGYPLHLQLLNLERFPVSGWYRLWVEQGRVARFVAIHDRPALTDEAAEALIRPIEPFLAAPAPSAAFAADVALYQGSAGAWHAGLLAVGAGRPEAGPAVDTLRHLLLPPRAPAPFPAPAASGGAEPDYWIIEP